MSDGERLSSLELARRLERVEALSTCDFVDARRVAFPGSNSAWMECAGVHAAFDTIDSPLTQSFGLGLFETVTPEALEKIEDFYRERKSAANHEVCTLSDVSTMKRLCERGYMPVEISDVLFRNVEMPEGNSKEDISAHVIGKDEFQAWTDVSTDGWTHELPELRSFMLEACAIAACRQSTFSFLASHNDVPGCAGALFTSDGVALFLGATTRPEMRRRGLQHALLQERMRFAFTRECDLAMMVAEPGSSSHKNAERAGFRIAYSRIKWQLKT